MSKKLVKCKTCGADIAKSANVCPHCGAKQHQGVYALCVAIVMITVFACIFILVSSISGGTSDTSSTVANQGSGESNTSSIVFSGKEVTVTYISLTDNVAVSGCVFLNLQIENIGEKEEWISLEDVYINNTACTTGTGAPVVVAPGKNANGAFILFYDGAIEDIKTLEYKVVISDNDTLSKLETSGAIQATF